jgi:hypothetical protein
MAGKEATMIELTEEQRRELHGNKEPVRVLDPSTHTEYVLVRADLYARFREALEQAEAGADEEAWLDAVEEARDEWARENPY